MNFENNYYNGKEFSIAIMEIQKKALKAGLIGGIGGLVFSMIINYFVIPMPESLIGNALGNGISGLISGFMGGFLAIKNNTI